MSQDFKVTYFFEQGKYGWSETWYKNAATIETALEHAITLALKRIALLGSRTEENVGDHAGNPPKMTAVRVSDVAIQRDSLLHQFGPDGRRAVWPDALHGADHPEHALMCRAESSSLYRRTVWLRGVPDLLWREEGGVTDPAWQTRFTAWANLLNTAGWRIRVVRNDGIGPIRIREFTRPVPGGPIHLVLAAPHDFLPNGKIRISGARTGRTGRPGAEFINKEWEVVLDLNDVILVGSQNVLIPAPYFGGATAKRQEIIYVPISQEGVKIRDHRTREAGVPFGSPVGSRRRPRLLTVL